MGTGTDALEPARALRLSRTLRRALRSWWDHLGLSCFLSAATVLAVTGLGAFCQRVGFFQPGALPVGITMAMLALVFLVAYLSLVLHVGILGAVHRRQETLLDALRPSFRELRQAVGLVIIQWSMAVVCSASIWFYAASHSSMGVLLAALLGYALVMWCATCTYHWPLLAAAQRGIIPPADSRRGPTLGGVLRNGLVLFLASPFYSLGLMLTMVVLGVVLTVTGIGLVLVAPALGGFLSTQAVHDHMVRLGMIPPPDEGPVMQDEWHVPGEQAL